MFEKEIFIGFPVDSLFEKELAKANQNVVAAFIQESNDYLQECLYENQRYIGKKAGANLSIAQIQLLEKNVYSLLRKIVPDFPYEETSLYLFPV